MKNMNDPRSDEHKGNNILDAPKIMARKDYGSVTGILRQITVDPADKNAPKHEFQLIDKDTGMHVVCVFDRTRAKDLHATARMVVYGEVVWDTNGHARRIEVDDFRVIPEKPVTLEQLHAMKLEVPNGEDAADFTHRTRGDGDDE